MKHPFYSSTQNELQDLHMNTSNLFFKYLDMNTDRDQVLAAVAKVRGLLWVLDTIQNQMNNPPTLPRPKG